MGKFLGIIYDKWHFILAILVIILIFAFSWFLFKPLLFYQIGPGFLTAFCWIIGVAIAHYLQCWYEIRQALKSDVVFEYGSWWNFVNNSKKDFKYFWRGVWFSWVPIIIFLLIFS